MSAALTLGVIGHVDHGKTALVRALTGIETDRLQEERERGLSIVLGFAYIETERCVVDLIDAPGHEDFVRAMISGATAVDGIVLCVAANEGVMPQTVEHFQIARLLGIETGFTVITKSDLADTETLALARAELDEFVQGSFLETAPVVEASAVSGEGVADVKREILRIAESSPERGDRGRFFLPLDRVFTLRGFGLVATGTLRGGALAVGEPVEVLPERLHATVRALQNHGRPIETASPGQRVAVNLRQLNRAQIRRGDVLAAPGYLEPTRRIDAELRLLDDVAPLKHRTQLRFATGTIEAMATVSLLDRRELQPGETGIAQLHLDRAIATRVSEPCLLRSVSPIRTLGGGRILSVNPGRHRRFDSAVTERLTTLASGDLERVLRQRLGEAGSLGVDLGRLAGELGAPLAQLDRLAGALAPVRIDAETVVAAAAYADLLEQIVAALERFHAAEPFRRGRDSAGLGNALAVPVAPKVLRHAVGVLVDQGRVRLEHELLCTAAHDPFARLGDAERKLAGELEQQIFAFGLEPPSPRALVGRSRARQLLLDLLIDSGRLIRLRTYKTESDLVLHAQVLATALRRIERAFPHPADFALKDVRDLLGSTRKYIVPLMEHFDASGATVRSGDRRRLRG